MALITCKNVSMGYEGRTVLNGINFKVDKGDYLCIVGENGSGKSTLMKGLLKLKLPIAGSIQMEEGLKASEIGYLPQQSDIQRSFPASVFEVVLSGRLNQLMWRPFFSRKDKQATVEKMRLLGIEQMKDQSFQELSGGQQQRVLLARALCATQRMLLLDEPTAGLDPLVAADMYSLIKEINQQYEMTVIMISHDIKAALKDSTHILHLGNKQLYYGTTEEYPLSPCGKEFLGGVQDV